MSGMRLYPSYLESISMISAGGDIIRTCDRSIDLLHLYQIAHATEAGTGGTGRCASGCTDPLQVRAYDSAQVPLEVTSGTCTSYIRTVFPTVEVTMSYYFGTSWRFFSPADL